MKSSIIVLGLLFSTYVFAENDDFDPLPAEEPSCSFQSYVTRGARNKPEILHQASHSASSNSPLEKLITESCRKCRQALSQAVQELRKKNIFLVQDRCYFDKCTYGDSDAVIFVSPETFKKALSNQQDSFYCGSQNAAPAPSN